MIWFWWIIKLSILFTLREFLKICEYISCWLTIQTHNGQFFYAWRMAYLYCAFNFRVNGEFKGLAVNVRVTQGTSEISYVIRARQIVRLSYVFLEWSVSPSKIVRCTSVSLTQFLTLQSAKTGKTRSTRTITKHVRPVLTEVCSYAPGVPLFILSTLLNWPAFLNLLKKSKLNGLTVCVK